MGDEGARAVVGEGRAGSSRAETDVVHPMTADVAAHEARVAVALAEQAVEHATKRRRQLPEVALLAAGVTRGVADGAVGSHERQASLAGEHHETLGAPRDGVRQPTDVLDEDGGLEVEGHEPEGVLLHHAVHGALLGQAQAAEEGQPERASLDAEAADFTLLGSEGPAATRAGLQHRKRRGERALEGRIDAWRRFRAERVASEHHPRARGGAPPREREVDVVVGGPGARGLEGVDGAAMGGRGRGLRRAARCAAVRGQGPRVGAEAEALAAPRAAHVKQAALEGRERVTIEVRRRDAERFAVGDGPAKSLQDERRAFAPGHGGRLGQEVHPDILRPPLGIEGPFADELAALDTRRAHEHRVFVRHGLRRRLGVVAAARDQDEDEERGPEGVDEAREAPDARDMRALVSIACLVALAAAPAAAQDLVLEGTLPAGPERFAFVPFEVPAGTREIVFTHGQVLDENIVDFGLNGPDPEGLSPSVFRGWSGSNGDVTQITAGAATPGYLPGPLDGAWELVLGAAKVDVDPAPYRIELTFRDEAAVEACAADAACVTLPPDPDRGPYLPPAPLRDVPGWYAGDLHVHSIHSGDATPTLDALADAAASIGLDWIEVSEHNTTSHLTVLSAVQARHRDVLLLPGIEWTTYGGHGNAIGLRRFVDHKVGSRGVTLEASVAEIRESGAVFAPVHPLIGIGDLCIGCDWDTSVDRSLIDALEVINGDIDGTGRARLEVNLQLWDEWCDEGRHVVAIGGSDSHRGLERLPTASPLGEPTTLVQADALSVDGLLAGLRAGRTVVKLGGPDDAMVELEVEAPAMRSGDTVVAEEATFVVRVSEGGGEAVPDALSLVVDGVERRRDEVGALPYETRITLLAPATGETRLRAEVWSGPLRRTLTSHLWLRRPEAGSAGGGGCAASAAGAGALVGLLCLALGRKRRTPPAPWHGPGDER